MLIEFFEDDILRLCAVEPCLWFGRIPHAAVQTEILMPCLIADFFL